MAILSVALFANFDLHAATIKSKQSGNWIAAATWIGGVVPGPNDDVVIQSGHSVVRDAALTFQKKLAIDGTLTFSGANNVSFTSFAQVILGASGAVSVNNTATAFDCPVSGTGSYRTLGGTVTFLRSYTVSMTQLLGGTSTFKYSLGVKFKDLIVENATLNGNAPMEVTNRLTWKNNGALLGTAGLTILNGAFAHISGTSHFLQGGTFTNQGTVKYWEGNIEPVVANMCNIANVGVWDDQASVGTKHILKNAVFHNYGTFNVLGAGTCSVNGNGFFENNATGNVNVMQGTFAVGGIAVEHTGTWTNNATIDVLVPGGMLCSGALFNNTGSIIGNGLCLVGGNAQQLSGAGTISVLRMKKSANHLTLQGHLKITFLLDLVTGNVILQNFDLNVSNVSIHNASPNSFVVTDGAGGLIRQLTAMSSGFIPFPIGNQAFVPLSLGLRTGSANDLFRVRTRKQPLYTEMDASGNSICGIGIPRTVERLWLVDELTPGGTTNLEVSLGWKMADQQAAFDANNCTVGQYIWDNWAVGAFGAATFVDACFYKSRAGLSFFGSTLLGVYDNAALMNLEAPTAQSNAPVLEGTDIKLEASFIPNATYQWTGPAGFFATGIQAVRPNALMAWAGGYCVTAIRYGCASTPGCVGVEIIPAPNAGNESEERTDNMAHVDVGLLGVAPNPVQNVAQVYFHLNEEGEGLLYLMDMNGKRIHQAKVKGRGTLPVDMTAFPAGIYQIMLETRQGVETQRVLKGQ